MRTLLIVGALALASAGCTLSHGREVCVDTQGQVDPYRYADGGFRSCQIGGCHLDPNPCEVSPDFALPNLPDAGL